MVCFEFIATPSSARALALVRGPYLQQATQTSIVVRWRTDLPAESTLRYGPTEGDLSTTITTPGSVTEHEIEVQGLQPATRYYYSIGTTSLALAGADAEHFFATTRPANTTESTRIWVIGDSGGNSPISAEVKNEYLNFAAGDLADVWLMLGDNAYLTGTDAQFTLNLFENYPQILRNTTLWPSPGNHDLNGIVEGEEPSSDPVTEIGPYYDAFTLPTQGESGGLPSGTETYYSFDFANIHFVSLNIYNIDFNVGSTVHSWLVADLAANQSEWTIVYLHFPPYSRGGRDSDVDFWMVKVRTLYNPVFEEGGVDLVLTGHSHTYERSMLIDGHYDVANTLTTANIMHGGNGDPDDQGPYLKVAQGNEPRRGTVYVVNGVGSSAHANGGALDHPVMVTAFELEGSMVIDIDGDTLDAYFISRYGDILDRFQIVKVVALPAGELGAWVVLALLLMGSAWGAVQKRAV